MVVQACSSDRRIVNRRELLVELAGYKVGGCRTIIFTSRMMRHIMTSASFWLQPKVVVFGGNGFVGSYVCRSLLGMGVAVTSINRSGQITYPEVCVFTEYIT